MIPNFEALCLEFIAVVNIEKVLYFHGLISMGESEPFTSQGSSHCVSENFQRLTNLNWVHHQQLALSGHKSGEENVPSLLTCCMQL